jgi:hypothetical protein
MFTGIFFLLIGALLLLGGCGSSAQEIQQLKEEIKILKEDNSLLKAQMAGLKKEAEELYRRLEDKEKTDAALKEAAPAPQADRKANDPARKKAAPKKKT